MRYKVKITRGVEHLLIVLKYYVRFVFLWYNINGYEAPSIGTPTLGILCPHPRFGDGGFFNDLVPKRDTSCKEKGGVWKGSWFSLTEATYIMD